MSAKKTPAGYEAKVKAPYRVRFTTGEFILEKEVGNAGKFRIITILKAQSANGADREAAIFLKM